MAATVVLYHSNCADGFGAAWAAWRRFGDSASYIPVNYGSPPPDECRGANVLVVDFSYPRETLERLRGDAASLRVIDHHRTAQADLGDLPYAVFDMQRSGAVLTWVALHDTPLPALLAYVQDRDLWRWQLPLSHEINAAIRGWPHDFQLWSGFAAELDELLSLSPLAWREDPTSSRVVLDGLAVLRSERQVVDTLVQHIIQVDLGFVVGTEAPLIVPAVNSPVYQSEIGHELCRRTGSPVSAVFTVGDDGGILWSLRSVGDFDVGAIAKKFGGGGHTNAAGFRSTVDGYPIIPWKLSELDAAMQAAELTAELAGCSLHELEAAAVPLDCEAADCDAADGLEQVIDPAEALRLVPFTRGVLEEAAALISSQPMTVTPVVVPAYVDLAEVAQAEIAAELQALTEVFVGEPVTPIGPLITSVAQPDPVDAALDGVPLDELFDDTI